MWEEEINYYEKLFEKDSREKKRIARGASARASRKKGFKGGVRTPSDFMTKKQIREMSGKVKVSNIYDKYKNLENLPDKQTMLQMSKNPDTIEELRMILETAKTVHSSHTIAKYIKMSPGTLYCIYDRVGVAYNKSKRTKQKVVPKLKEEEEVTPIEVKPINQFTINMKGTYSKEDIENRILASTNLMLDDSTYEFEMILKEI